MAWRTFAIDSESEAEDSVFLPKTAANQHLPMNYLHQTTKILLQMMKNQMRAENVAEVVNVIIQPSYASLITSDK